MTQEPRAFIIGWPVAHSRSPLIHRHWLDELGIKGSYEAVALPPDELEGFLSTLGEQGFVGGNVTLPHKEKAFALCAETTPTAARLEAVNTLWMEAGKLHGDNTDVIGFLAALDEDVPGWGKVLEKVVVLGAGGAGRGIVHGLMLRGAERILVINRTRARSEELRLRFGATIALGDLADLPAALAGADLLVNTTSLGMAGQAPLDIDLAPLPDHAVVSDIVYVPLETELLRRARRRGLRTSAGLGMLLHQAVPGFERWFGRRPEVTPELRARVAADIEERP
ncbi:MAG TPA: shikimate dehydrogenase [Methylovirgula sp.]|nr:shikimate dehydrogenase [Methylovirgula sp.]